MDDYTIVSHQELGAPRWLETGEIIGIGEKQYNVSDQNTDGNKKLYTLVPLDTDERVKAEFLSWSRDAFFVFSPYHEHTIKVG